LQGKYEIYPFIDAKLQEQEQEQEVEMEVQKEETRVEASAARQDYSREEESLIPFKLACLSSASEKEKLGFFPFTEFSIKTWKGATKPMPFPSFLFFSRNYYNPRWSTRSLRRLKNVIALVEWIPCVEELAASKEECDLSKDALRELDRVFNMFDLDQVGTEGCVSPHIWQYPIFLCDLTFR
jgi:hypothetical protein